MSHAQDTRRPRRIIPLHGERLSIRHDGVLLAVPPMHRKTPAATRQQVFELVLRRLYGEAVDLAADTADAIEHRDAHLARLAALLQQTPHRNARGFGLAA